MTFNLFALIALLMVAMGTAPAADAIDPAVVGTWKLEWQGADIFWAVRPDGVYRLHGPGARVRQLGRIEASQGRFWMKSPFWSDAGPYKLSNADTLVITGQLGPGTWRRVWVPVKTTLPQPPGVGTCGLLAEGEVAQVLRAPASGGFDRGNPDRCVYKSLLNSADQVSVTVIPARREAWYLKRRTPQPSVIAVPGVGEDAYAERQTSHLLVHILKGASQAAIRLTLTPDATMEDLPYLTELARAADQRLGGFLLPVPGQGTADMPKKGTGGWIPGGNRPPQKGPKPFKGW